MDGDVGFIEHCQVNVRIHLASAVPGEVGEHDVANVIGGVQGFCDHLAEPGSFICAEAAAYVVKLAGVD